MKFGPEMHQALALPVPVNTTKVNGPRVSVSTGVRVLTSGRAFIFAAGIARPGI